MAKRLTAKEIEAISKPRGKSNIAVEETEVVENSLTPRKRKGKTFTLVVDQQERLFDTDLTSGEVLQQYPGAKIVKEVLYLSKQGKTSDASDIEEDV